MAIDPLDLLNAEKEMLLAKRNYETKRQAYNDLFSQNQIDTIDLKITTATNILNSGGVISGTP